MARFHIRAAYCTETGRPRDWEREVEADTFHEALAKGRNLLSRSTKWRAISKVDMRATVIDEAAA